MDSSRRPGAFSPTTPTPTQYHHRASSTDESDSSTSSQVTAMTSNRPIYTQQQSSGPRPPLLSTTSSNNSSTTSLHNFSRPSIAHVVSDVPSRKNSPLNPATDPRSHKRNNSQGFFEPSLPTASSHLEPQQSTAAMPGLSASQIAAQAAMQAQSGAQHARKRSQTVPSPQVPQEPNHGRQKPPPLPTSLSATGRRPSGQAVVIPPSYPQQSTNSPTLAATTAANAVYPNAMQLSPGLTSFSNGPGEGKAKSERSKMKLFSKPKHIGIPGYKEGKDNRLLPSPGKITSPPSLLSNQMNASTTSLADSVATSSSTLYSMQNSSTSTLMPTERQRAEDKEKAHKHHFLSRQKNKLKDRMDDHSTLTLSSASSNSKPIDPGAPSIYSFAPSSPGLAQGTFAKSVSGLDLRHGGRALREKKREEKTADQRRAEADRQEWLAASYGPPSGSGASIYGGGPSVPEVSNYANLAGFGVSNMTSEEAWDFLKAKILIIFEGEELRMPVEDLNRLVSVHIQRCVQKRAPATLIEDLEDLLQTGFLSLDQTLRGVQDDKLVPYLVEMWLFVFGTILPYMQAVFLPLDLEFHGHGPIMSSREATEFWGVPLDNSDAEVSLDYESTLDVRRAVLLNYRDNVILPRFDALKAVFSRLSLESINVMGLGGGLDSPLQNSPLTSPPALNGRPGTAGSLDPSYGSSFNSQGSTLLSEGARSRAASNTSAPELPPFSPRNRPPGSVLQAGLQAAVGSAQMVNSAQVTETVGRMLQCMSVLASIRSGDEAQARTEELTRALKLNWLGRGRTGRNRKGFVGARVVRRGVRA